MAYPKVYRDRYEDIEAYRKLSHEEKFVILTHADNPTLDYSQIAQICNLPGKEIARILTSSVFRKISFEIAEIAQASLVLLAIHTLRKNMLSENEFIRMKAALSLLSGKGIFKVEPTKVRNDNKVVVLWDDGNKQTRVMGPINTCGDQENGGTRTMSEAADKLLASSETG